MSDLFSTIAGMMTSTFFLSTCAFFAICLDMNWQVTKIVFCALKNFSRNRQMAVRRKWPTGADDGRPERSDHMSEKEKTLRAFAEILKILQDNGYHFSEFDKGRIYEMMHRAQCVAASS